MYSSANIGFATALVKEQELKKVLSDLPFA
jgi:hypothetical protein